MQTLVIYFLISFAILGRCFAGGISGGGGGTTIVYNGQRVFLDLLMIPDFREKVMSYQSTETFDPFVEAQKLLAKWDEQRLSVSSAMAQSAFDGSVKWNIVDKDFALSTRYYVPEDIQASEPKTIAYYKKINKRSFFVDVSRQGLAEVNALSQLALGVHESLRHLQIGWDAKNNGFSERALQEATAIYVLCKPNNALAMYVNFLLNSERSEVEKFYGDLSLYVKNNCKAAL